MNTDVLTGTATLCPSCLTELPPGYPYDHVAIDRALTGRPELFRTFSPAEQAETVKAGLTRRMSYNRLARLFHRSVAHLRDLAGDVPASFDVQVHQLYRRGHNDQEIAVSLGVHRKTVQTSRDRQGLAPLYGPGGRRRWKEAGIAA